MRVREMPRLRTDEFIYDLCQLLLKHPEYASVLNPLIDLIKQGKQDRIHATLGRLKNEDW
jgi:hypothetical protein